MKRSIMLRVVLSVLVLSLALPVAVFAGGAGEKAKVSFFWALYDGLTEDFRASLETAFNKANPDTALQIVPVKWDDMQNKLTTSLAGGTPPELAVIGTRWLLDYMDTNSVDEVTKYVSKATIDNIAPGAIEAKINGKLMGIPVAAGARILTINTDITSKVPATMEEMREEAKRITVPGKVYGMIMPGKKHTETTDFCYYFYAAGGDYFATNADGSYGKCTVNSDAGVKALTYMADVAMKDKSVQDGFTSMTRMDSHPVFYAGKVGYVMIGAWVDSAMKQANATFKVKYAQIPPFAGKKQTGLIITDSIAFFSKAKGLKEAGKFIDFFYKDEWKGKFDQLIGFPPVTMSAAKAPEWQTPLYKTLGEAALTAKPWPLIKGWDEFNNIIWDACEKVFQGQASPKAALDEAASKIDAARGL
jgi:multiple sugar transport system substrate-binding protein